MQKRIQPSELIVQSWINTDEDISLSALQGKVVAMFAFQMLCPGCVQHSLPQANRVYSLFNRDDIAVIGLHSVFEHHDAMTETALKAFAHENRLNFPIAIDKPSEDANPLPQSMRQYHMEGTPTLMLLDRSGYLRKYKFGHEQDLVLGADIATLIAEPYNE